MLLLAVLLLFLLLSTCLNCLYLFIFFFFQAEDGIRDIGVTGVQTCALPISGSTRLGRSSPGSVSRARARVTRRPSPRSSPRSSEERRVGKECRSRWAPY